MYLLVKNLKEGIESLNIKLLKQFKSNNIFKYILNL